MIRQTNRKNQVLWFLLVGMAVVAAPMQALLSRGVEQAPAAVAREPLLPRSFDECSAMSNDFERDLRVTSQILLECQRNQFRNGNYSPRVLISQDCVAKVGDGGAILCYEDARCLSQARADRELQLESKAAAARCRDKVRVLEAINSGIAKQEERERVLARDLLESKAEADRVGNREARVFETIRDLEAEAARIALRQQRAAREFFEQSMRMQLAIQQQALADYNNAMAEVFAAYESERRRVTSQGAFWNDVARSQYTSSYTPSTSFASSYASIGTTASTATFSTSSSSARTTSSTSSYSSGSSSSKKICYTDSGGYKVGCVGGTK